MRVNGGKAGDARKPDSSDVFLGAESLTKLYVCRYVKRYVSAFVSHSRRVHDSRSGSAGRAHTSRGHAIVDLEKGELGGTEAWRRRRPRPHSVVVSLSMMSYIH